MKNRHIPLVSVGADPISYVRPDFYPESDNPARAGPVLPRAGLFAAQKGTQHWV